MSNIYDHWQPSVGDRVRVVLRDETGARAEYGPSGTIVGVLRDPVVLYEVEYDAPTAEGASRAREALAIVELEPLEASTVRLVRDEVAPSHPPTGTGPTWQPTVGDRVVTRTGNLAGTLTAVDERGGEPVCEVAFDHQPDEPELPQRRSYAVGELTPIREPSAAVLDAGRPR